ncbi:unnamed protein product [Pleuronectes platessa]|uniref:Uncharacterized protein n=1 Tax=Pleuronectes platessa TaxID=8262 RepID=A0A9N7YJ28_PLEPL|nr:unnamed protein product [Pleuronectes platessa]
MEFKTLLGEWLGAGLSRCSGPCGADTAAAAEYSMETFGLRFDADPWGASSGLTVEAVGTASYQAQQPITDRTAPHTEMASRCAHARVSWSVKMAALPGPLDELPSQTQVNKALVRPPVRAVESQLSVLSPNDHWGRRETAAYYTAIVPGQAGSF